MQSNKKRSPAKDIDKYITELPPDVQTILQKLKEGNTGVSIYDRRKNKLRYTYLLP